MNRVELRQLAEDRVQDAAALIAVGRWSGAYYLSGYAVECALKACILAHVEATGAIFLDRKYAEKCWTHDLDLLLELANLRPAFDADSTVNPGLVGSWRIVRTWTETSRYEQKLEEHANRLFDAVTNNSNGVLPWIRNRW